MEEKGGSDIPFSTSRCLTTSRHSCVWLGDLGSPAQSKSSCFPRFWSSSSHPHSHIIPKYWIGAYFSFKPDPVKTRILWLRHPPRWPEHGRRTAVSSYMSNGCHINIKQGEQAEGSSEGGPGQIGCSPCLIKRRLINVRFWSASFFRRAELISRAGESDGAVSVGLKKKKKQFVQVQLEKVEPASHRPTLRWLNVGSMEQFNQSQIGNAAKRRRKQFMIISGSEKRSVPHVTANCW